MTEQFNDLYVKLWSLAKQLKSEQTLAEESSVLLLERMLEVAKDMVKQFSNLEQTTGKAVSLTRPTMRRIVAIMTDLDQISKATTSSNKIKSLATEIITTLYQITCVITVAQVLKPPSDTSTDPHLIISKI